MSSLRRSRALADDECVERAVLEATAEVAVSLPFSMTVSAPAIFA